MRRIVLLANLAIASMLPASPAFAEGEAPTAPSSVQASSEVTGSACDTVIAEEHVASSNCTIHADSLGAIDMIGHTIFGESIAARCDSHFTGAVNGSGAGVIGMNQIWITSPLIGGIDCPPNAGGVTECTEATANGVGHSADWDIQIYESFDGLIWMDVELCIENTLVGTLAGDLWVRVNDTFGDGHVTSFSANQTPTPNGGHAIRNLEAGALGPEFWGSWNVTGNTIEVDH